MYYIQAAVSNEIIIDKSRFIGQLYPISSVDEADQLLEQIRTKHRDANHNCYAYIINDGKIMKASDDKEPAKTAGIPILEVLKHHQLTNVLCVVTRYFGGIKLGAGGLIRAYSNATVDVLKLAELYQIQLCPTIKMVMPYGLYDTLIYQLKDVITVTDQVFGAQIELTAVLNQISIHELQQTYHKIQIEDLGLSAVKMPKID